MSQLMEPMRFPSEAKNALQPTVSIEDVYGRDEVYVDGPDATARCIEPLDNNFEIQLSANALVPVRIAQRQKEVKRQLRNLFRKEVMYHHIPGSITADGVLLLSEQATKEQRQHLAETLYPTSEAHEELGETTLVTLPEENPIYVNHHGEDVTAKPPHTSQHREQLSRDSLLTTELHQLIEQRGGRVVYEGAAEGADRLVIALQNVHGNHMTPWQLYLHYGKRVAEKFLAYQQAMTKTMGDIADMQGNDKTQYILETMSNDPTAIAQHLRFVGRVVRSVTNRAFQHLATGKHSWAKDSLHAGANLRSAAQYDKRGCRMYGDNREDRDHDFSRTEKAVKDGRRQLRKEGFGVGSAAAFNEDQSRYNHQITQKSHQEIMQGIATNLSAGDTGVLLYGAGHFSSGTRADREHKDSLDGHELEHYFRFLPRTQLVVVEWKEAEDIFNKVMATHKTLNAMPKVLRFEYNTLMRKLDDSISNLEVLAIDRQLHKKTDEIDRKIHREVKHRDATVQELRDLVHKKAGEKSHLADLQQEVRQIIDSMAQPDDAPDDSSELEIPDDFWSDYGKSDTST